MPKLGAAVIGARMGSGHVQGYVNNPNTELRAVCDTDLESARRVAAQHSVPLVTDNWDELLERDDIHIVSVATPDPLHEPMTVRSLEAGKHGRGVPRRGGIRGDGQARAGADRVLREP